MRAAIVVAGAAAGAALLLPGPAASGRQKPYVLTALADIGTVYWRYDCVHYRRPEWSLGVRLFRDSATTTVTFRAGALRQHRTRNPGDPTAWFPFRAEKRQRLSLVQGTEPRTLYARVIARFGGTHLANCRPYAPPHVTATLRMVTNF
jgi:hypothetical protein